MHGTDLVIAFHNVITDNRDTNAVHVLQDIQEIPEASLGNFPYSEAASIAAWTLMNVSKEAQRALAEVNAKILRYRYILYSQSDICT